MAAPSKPTKTDLPARLTVARWAPFAFLGLTLVFGGLFALAWFADERVNWTALMLALATLPALVITWVNRETINALCAENDDLKRDLRSVGRLSL